MSDLPTLPDPQLPALDYERQIHALVGSADPAQVVHGMELLAQAGLDRFVAAGIVKKVYERGCRWVAQYSGGKKDGVFTFIRTSPQMKALLALHYPHMVRLPREWKTWFIEIDSPMVWTGFARWAGSPTVTVYWPDVHVTVNFDDPCVEGSAEASIHEFFWRKEPTSI